MNKYLLVLAILSVAFITSVYGESKTLPKGQPALVEKTVDKHLFHIYVTPPKATKDYSHGDLSVMLKRESPDYIYVSLKYDVMKDGRLYVKVAISPKDDAKYSIVVLDKHGEETFISYWRTLKDTNTLNNPSTSAPNTPKK